MFLTVNQLRAIVLKEVFGPQPEGGGSLILYHVGSKKPGVPFDLKHIGTGEGFKGPPLGLGIYFTDVKDVAEAYKTYSREPFLTTVRVPTSTMYDLRNGTPGKKEALEELLHQASEETGIDPTSLPAYKYARVMPNNNAAGLIAMLGVEEAISRMASIGVHGWFVKINGGVGIPDSTFGEYYGFSEYCIFDPSIIEIVSEEPLEL